MFILLELLFDNNMWLSRTLGKKMVKKGVKYIDVKYLKLITRTGKVS